MLRTTCIILLFASGPFFIAATIEPQQERLTVVPIDPHQWDETTRIWLARSCVGEAGFEAIDECTAIAWVYSVRSKYAGRPLLKIIRKYSAATKRHSLHRRPWLMELDSSLKKPPSWPSGPAWKNYKEKWHTMLQTLDFWSEGQVPNLVPEANHYGSRSDARRALLEWRWKKLDTPAHFRNWFFDSTQRTGKRELQKIMRMHRLYPRVSQK